MVFGKNILCPYCLNKLSDSDVKIVCNFCGDEITPTTFEKIRRIPPRCKTPGCRGIGSKRQCRICTEELPADIMDYSKYLRFSILGITGAGKTVFLTTMMHELVTNIVNFPMVFQAMNDKTQIEFRMQEDNLFTKGKMPEPTTAGIAPEPQLWRIKDKSRMTDSRIPAYSMTIFDGAGEDSEHIDPTISRYIEGSKTLIILVDPLALPGVSDMVDERIRANSTKAVHGIGASTDMVNGLAAYIRQNCGLAPNKLISKDVAIVFTKFDTVRSSFGQATVTKPSPHLARKGFVKADADAVDLEIRDWLKKHGESTFIDTVETNFKKEKVRFFGVSSLGQAPKDAKQTGKVISHRVTDPMIWMLSIEGIVPVIE